uniref:sphingomyelin phosphodiesterase n=1 Tax=Tabanus bromius TaxID=304241 RepID=A0A0K8TSH4_TABBR
MIFVLNILTLNVWGIPYISRDREERIKAIGDELSKGIFDVVSLQEVWSQSDYETLKKRTSNVLPYTHYFHSGVAGSGLCLLSKYPIISAFFHAWSVNGYVHRIQHGDWFGGKGVGLCRILVKNQPINVYVAHLHAEYDTQNDEYKAHRVIQAFDTAQFIESTRSDSILQILAGDLNTEPEDISYKVLTKTSKLKDTCNLELIGTNECERNSYTPLEVVKSNSIGKRIDHILFRPGEKHTADVIQYELPFHDRIPGKTFSYSDHEAVYAKISISAKKNLPHELEGEQYCYTAECLSSETLETIAALNESIAICDDILHKLHNHRIVYLTSALIFSILLFIVIDISPPYGFKLVYLIIKVILSGMIIFCIFMGTLWNIMEKNGILSGKLSMEIALRYIERQN